MRKAEKIINTLVAATLILAAAGDFYNRRWDVAIVWLLALLYALRSFKAESKLRRWRAWGATAFRQLEEDKRLLKELVEELEENAEKEGGDK